MNLPVTAKDAQLQTQVKLQIPRIEAHKDKGSTAPAPGIYRNGQNKTQDFKGGMRRAQLVIGTFFRKMSV